MEVSANGRSHPVWVCGLKHVIGSASYKKLVSHPVWVCGLKLATSCVKVEPDGVTPCMGVWIETYNHLH